MTKKRRPRKGVSQAQRDAIRFAPVEAAFTWTNEEWGLTHLPRVRMAVVFLQRDREGLGQALKQFNDKGMIPDLLDGMIGTRRHLEALVETLDTALARSFLVLEDLGYSPDAPPSNVVKLPVRSG